MNLEKFKEKNRKKTGIVIFTICCVLLVAGVYFYTSFALYEKNQNFNIINGNVQDPGDLYFAFYVNNVASSTMPTKESGYILDESKTNCTSPDGNTVTVTLDEADWSIKINGMTSSRTKCTLYFKSN